MQRVFLRKKVNQGTLVTPEDNGIATGKCRWWVGTTVSENTRHSLMIQEQWFIIQQGSRIRGLPGSQSCILHNYSILTLENYIYHSPSVGDNFKILLSE